MFYPATGELETFWTGFSCKREDCPGKRHNRRRAKGEKAHPWTLAYKRTKEVQAWLDEHNRDSPTYTKHSPGYWNDNQPSDQLGWDNPDSDAESLYGT